tara:strand:- start:2340 stop:3017 length:678 start_codon:yes stop_codon:yes gene_type:complete
MTERCSIEIAGSNHHKKMCISKQFVKPDRDDGTEEGSRKWAKKFYLYNSRFLHDAIMTTDELRYFFDVWMISVDARDLVNSIGYRRSGQVLHALIVDGKVLYTKNRTLTGNSSVIWTHSCRTSPVHIDAVKDVLDMSAGCEDRLNIRAKDFYKTNIGFLRGVIKTDWDLEYFYKIWISSKGPYYRPLSHITNDLCNLQVCRIIEKAGKPSFISWAEIKALPMVSV